MIISGSSSFSFGSGVNNGGPASAGDPRLIDNPLFLEDPLPLNIVDRAANVRHLGQYLKYLNATYKLPQIERISQIENALKHMETMGEGELYSLVVDGGYDWNTGRGSHATLLVKGHVPICVWFGSRLRIDSHDMECEGLLIALPILNMLTPTSGGRSQKLILV